MLSPNPEDGYLCDRCGEPATHFHEDYGNVCPECCIYWSREVDTDPPMTPEQEAKWRVTTGQHPY